MESETIWRIERTYGVTPGWAVFWLCLLLATFALAVFVPVRSVGHGLQGWALALRLLLIWAVPVAGPTAILLSLHRLARTRLTKDEPPLD